MSLAQPKIDIPYKELQMFCKRNYISKLALFGSVLRDDFTPQSDVDVLVEFEPEHMPGLEFFGMEAELSSMLKRNVDFNTFDFLSPYFRDEVKAEAKVIYVKT